MKKHWMLLAALFMLSCSDDNEKLIKYSSV